MQFRIVTDTFPVLQTVDDFSLPFSSLAHPKTFVSKSTTNVTRLQQQHIAHAIKGVILHNVDILYNPQRKKSNVTI